MTEEQRKSVESLFHEVLAMPEDERESFLARACPDDPGVRQQVSVLLSDRARADEFFKQIRLSSSDCLALESSALPRGSRIGRYQITALLGRGGMGEVYLAEDPNLKRKVAIKILPYLVASNPELIERLRQEAHAASALNHPNILTIYEFGQEGELHYIVNEFVEGTSLRDLIGQLAEEQAFEYGRQIGHALAAAHTAGIIHRDIKPENIIVRSDGYLKVLDFGLAKLASAPADSFTSESPERVDFSATRPGTLMGTINYMSPEQARGEAVDARTDIWSWGVVLYEMLAGHRPYEALNVSELQVAQAQPLLPPNRDKRTRKVFSRALTQQLGRRYSTIEEALSDLPHGPMWILKRFMRKRIQSFALQEGKLQWKPWTALICLLALLGLGIKEIIDRRLDVTYQVSSTQSMTINGQVIALACSPDGDYIVYAAQEIDGQALRVVQLPSLNDMEIIPPGTWDYSGITVARDGFIYYVARENMFGKLYKIPLRGGKSEEIKLAGRIDSAISFSPDEKQFAFYREDPDNNATTLVLHDVISGGEREIASRHWPDVFLQSPLWGPGDNQVTVAVISQNASEHAANFMFQAVRADNGKEIESIVKPWRWVGRFAWLNRGRALAVAEGSIGTSRAQLMQVKWPSGAEFALIQDPGDYRDLSTSLDSQKITTLQVGRNSRLWIVSLQDPEQANAITIGGKYFGVSWTSSKQLLTQKEVNKRSMVWMVNPESRDEHAITTITNDSFSYQEAVGSPDGKYLVYVSDRDGTQHIWRSNRDGSNPVRLTTTSFRESSPTFSPGGQWVYFVSAEAGFILKRVRITGGASEKVKEHNVKAPSISPDGSRVVCYYYLDPVQEWKVAVLTLGTDKVQIIPDIPSGDDALPIRWTADGKQLLYAVSDKNHVFNVWAHKIDRSNGGVDRQLTHFTDDSIFAFAPSPDGKKLALVRGNSVSEINLMQITH